MKRMLIVDDDPNMLMFLEHMLEGAGFSTTTTWSREEALRLSVQQSFDSMLIAESLGGADSTLFREQLGLLQPDAALRLIPVGKNRPGELFDLPEAVGMQVGKRCE